MASIRMKNEDVVRMADKVVRDGMAHLENIQKSKPDPLPKQTFFTMLLCPEDLAEAVKDWEVWDRMDSRCRGIIHRAGLIGKAARLNRDEHMTLTVDDLVILGLDETEKEDKA